MTAAARTVAVAIRWARSTGTKDCSAAAAEVMYSSCGCTMATFVHPVAVFSVTAAMEKRGVQTVSNKNDSGMDNGRVCAAKPPRRSRNANVRRAGQRKRHCAETVRGRTARATSRGTNRGHDEQSKWPAAANEMPAFGGGGNNNNSRQHRHYKRWTWTMLLTPHMANSGQFGKFFREFKTSASTVPKQMPQGSNSTSAADMPMPVGQTTTIAVQTSAGTVLQQMPQGSNSTSAVAAADMPIPFFGHQPMPVAFSSGGGSLTVAAHMPWEMRRRPKHRSCDEDDYAR
ncbi:hypothetical protein niasHS_004340 [Heterodera schachtii]|uniref:Uncharacterized protein n=1 Tax=Heterodera schachtii TaxID=97005 RepID=A0ABD2K0F9_HETSC